MFGNKINMVCFVLLCVVMSVVSGKNLDNNARGKRTIPENSCETVRPFFQQHNITVGDTVGSTRGSVCGGQCCDDETEKLLRKQGQKVFADRLRHNQGPLNRTATVLLNHVTELARQSENKTLILFAQIYQGMAVLSRQPIKALYRDINEYIQTNHDLNEKPSKTPEDVAKNVIRFFTELFPLAYHHSTGLSNKDFSVKYKQCLKDNIDTIIPFGDIPKKLAQSLSKSLEATRLMFQAFSIGIEVLNTTDTLLIEEQLSGNTECHNAMLKMNYCPKCLGMSKNAKPCSGYCLNVMRGCVTKYAAELDLPWNGYVENVEKLLNAVRKSNDDSGVNLDLVIRNLDTKISAAIMYSMEKIKDIDGRVQTVCKLPEFSQKEDPLLAGVTPAPTVKTRLAHARNFPHFPDGQLSHFLAALVKTKGFYANIADTVCKDSTFAEQKDTGCWNGERIAEYTKTVTDVSLSQQKYNPEVRASTDMQNVDPRVANLVDKLRHVHHMAIKSLGTNYSDVDYMQRDGADGSGSGSGPDFDDGEDEYTRGSGSGHGPIEDVDSHDPSVTKNNYNTNNSPPNTHDERPTVHVTGSAASGNVAASTLLVLLTVLTTVLTRY